jgi:hypothetical protein
MMKPGLASKTLTEPAKKTKVCYEADVVVVGGGPGGHSAAVAAARNGADTVLVERYGHLGGMATGGLVILIPHMSDGTQEQQIAGLCQEWIDRLDAIGGALHPKREELGSSDKNVVSRWQRYFSTVVEGRVRQTVYVDPELLKCVLNNMVREAGIKLFLHSWGTQTIVVEGKVQGIIFESKSGRQAILGKVIIDGTGDGDLLPSAGAEFDDTLDRELRNSMLALVFRLGNVDFNKFSDFREAEPQKHDELMLELTKVAGTRLLPLPSSRNDVVWVNNWIPGLSSTNVEDLTRIEIDVRKMMLVGHDFLKKHFPGFEKSFILDTASQTGTRGSRRLIGEYMVTKDDIRSSKEYPDTIAVFPRLGPPAGTPHAYIPYRSLVPMKTEGLLVAGRSFSSDTVVNNMFNLIPHCAAIGQAAGTAAALAIKQGVNPRQLDHRFLQDTLLNQGVSLPGVEPSARR